MLPFTSHRNTTLVATLVLVITSLSTAPAGAATRTVCSSGCDHVTIQAAINAALPGDLILISEPYHTEADIVVDKNLEIAGVGTPPPVVQAASAPATAGLRILEVLPNTIVTVRDLALRFGQDLQGWGGAIRNNGILTLLRVEVTDNESSSKGGGIGSYGPLVIEDSVIARNTAGGGGGVYCADGCSSLEVHGSLFDANTALSAPGGGGLFTAAPTLLAGSELRGNTSNSDGGAITASNLIVIDSDLIDNASDGPGGAISSYHGLLTMVGCTVAGNHSESKGGGIWSVGNASQRKTNIDTTLFESNSAKTAGGAIFADYVDLTVRRSTFRFNAAGNLSFIHEGGGAIFTDDGLVEESVIYGNSANGFGGGIFIDDDGLTGLTLRNSTVSGNQATRQGGGIYADADASLSNVTITDNDADPAGASGADGGGIAVTAGPSVDIRNSIIAGNRDGTPNPLTRAADCLGPVTNAGYLHLGGLGNVFLDPACVVSGQSPDLGGDPGLGPLADNGGPTLTHALLAGSQNLDAGDPSGCKDELGHPLHLDQRGSERLGSCDRGAFELGGDPALFRDGFESGGPWRWDAAGP